MKGSYNYRSNNSVNDIWDDDNDDFEMYNNDAYLAAKQDFIEENGYDIVEEEEERLARRAARFNNPHLPNINSAESVDSKWDKYRT